MLQTERLLIVRDVLFVARLYNSGLADKAIMSRLGHRSDAVHGYKRPSLELEISVSKVLLVVAM